VRCCACVVCARACVRVCVCVCVCARARVRACARVGVRMGMGVHVLVHVHLHARGMSMHVSSRACLLECVVACMRAHAQVPCIAAGGGWGSMACGDSCRAARGFSGTWTCTVRQRCVNRCGFVRISWGDPMKYRRPQQCQGLRAQDTRPLACTLTLPTTGGPNQVRRAAAPRGAGRPGQR
jgi:hypothetical protein